MEQPLETLQEVDPAGRAAATWRRAAVASLATILVLVTAALLLHRRDVRYRESLLLREGSHAVALEREFLARELRALESDLRFLAQQPLLERLLAGEPAARSALEREYAGFARSKPFYDQIRVLDAAGMEIVRINRRGDGAQVVPASELQPKASRYYFQEARRLAPGQVFVSPLDLNVERGEIEQPLNPVIRLVTPVADSAGAGRGYLVLNYAGARLLGTLREIAGATRGENMLVNAQGEYLQAPDPGREWGWLLGHSRAFRDDHPEVWEQIREIDRSQIRVDGNLFTADWVPLGDDADRRSAVAVVSRIPLRDATALQLGAGSVLLSVSAVGIILAVALAWARTTEARRAQERRIAASEARLRMLSSRLLAAQEEERRSLSRMFHDELGQRVTAVALDLKSALRNVEKSEPTLRRAIAETESVLSSLHEIATRVRPSVLDDLGLADAVESFLADYEDRTGVSVDADLRLPPEARSGAGAAAENVYRILQEALANIASHAGTDAARVALRATGDALELTVEDEGRGFDVSRPPRSSRLGLLGIRERVELLGGEFSIESEPGRGTRIHVRVPLHAASEHPES